MAIFNLQRKKKDAEADQKKKPAFSSATKSVKTPVMNVSHIENISVLKSPRITEKVSQLMDLGVYTFDVYKSTIKDQVKKAVFGRYHVVPTKVNMVHVQSKRKSIRGKIGRTSSGKKALVYLKKGDKIEII